MYLYVTVVIKETIYSTFWDFYTGIDVVNVKCGVHGCDEDAKVGRCMWVKQLKKFCFIMPKCVHCI